MLNHASSTQLFVSGLIIIVLLSAFVGNVTIGGIGLTGQSFSADIGSGTIAEAGSVWDVLSSTAGGFLALLVFDMAPGGPVFLSLVFWMIGIAVAWAIVSLVRGTS
jgi:hypothetical protein